MISFDHFYCSFFFVQTRPRDYENRIQRKKLCIYPLWKAHSSKEWSVLITFTLLIELWNAGRREYCTVRLMLMLRTFREKHWSFRQNYLLTPCCVIHLALWADLDDDVFASSYYFVCKRNVFPVRTLVQKPHDINRTVPYWTTNFEGLDGNGNFRHNWQGP